MSLCSQRPSIFLKIEKYVYFKRTDMKPYLHIIMLHLESLSRLSQISTSSLIAKISDLPGQNLEDN